MSRHGLIGCCAALLVFGCDGDSEGPPPAPLASVAAPLGSARSVPKPADSSPDALVSAPAVLPPSPSPAVSPRPPAGRAGTSGGATVAGGFDAGGAARRPAGSRSEPPPAAPAKGAAVPTSASERKEASSSAAPAALGGVAADDQITRPSLLSLQITRLQQLEGALALAAPNCDTAGQLRDTVCGLADRICALEPDDPRQASVADPQTSCNEAESRCRRARLRFADRCAGK